MKHTCGTRLLGMLFKTKKGDKVLNFSLLFFFFFRIRSLKFSIKYCEIDIEGPQLEKKKKKLGTASYNYLSQLFMLMLRERIFSFFLKKKGKRKK